MLAVNVSCGITQIMRSYDVVLTLSSSYVHLYHSLP